MPTVSNKGDFGNKEQCLLTLSRIPYEINCDVHCKRKGHIVVYNLVHWFDVSNSGFVPHK